MAAESMVSVVEERGEREAPSRRVQLLADGTLVGMTLVWGCSFVLVKDIVAVVPPMLWLAVRFAFGALALAVIVVAARRWRGLTWREVRWGALLGVVLWAAYALQTVGLQSTSASNGGFITGLSVVLVPLFGLFILGQRPDRWAVIGVVMATVGLALLSLHIEERLGVSWGDALVFGCAIAFAVQIVLVSHVAGWADPLRVTLVQVLTAAVLYAVSAMAAREMGAEKAVAGLSAGVWVAAAVMGVVATALAIVVQTSVQRYAPAVHLALIFTLEPVFAAIAGAWFQGDRLGPAALVGAGLILAGMLASELGPRGRDLPEGDYANGS